jgi:predicted metal-dependent hydrolase
MTIGLPFNYHIRRSERATSARIVVKPGLVEVVAPWQIPEHKLHSFVHAKQQWVSQALRKMSAAKTQQAGFVPDAFVSGSQLSYLGETYPLTVQTGKLKRTKIEFKGGGYCATVPAGLTQEEQSEQIKMALIKWMHKQCKLLVEELTTKHAAKRSLTPRSITIKIQKSRWGSCGIHNDIHINWLLLMAPLEVLEYVVVHELCHIREKNHSVRFWSLVGEHLPDYRERRHWLKTNGRALMLAFS